jgi:hypothetical protein
MADAVAVYQGDTPLGPATSLAVGTTFGVGQSFTATGSSKTYRAHFL